MAVRDDRGDVKQTTAGFRGPLMVQSLTSAKSKFLSLYGIQSGNFVGQCMIVMAVILHHQGIDVQKKYPKIEKFVQWASENYKNAKELGFSGGNNNLRFLSDNPLKRNTAGWIYLWDKEFGTNYTESNNFPPETRTMITYGIADASNIITP